MMTARLARLFSFPLLSKELTEAAARRRTFIIRVVYALLLYTVFAFTMPRWLFENSSPSMAMGVGHQLYEQLTLLQMLGIALFLPAMMCGSIAQEKERDSLVLLFLTELRPWQIILQKYFGGLVPMFSFLLLAMPLAAVAYAFGGVTAWKLFGYLYALVLTCLQVGAIALLCSTWCRTTVGAFITTYIFAACFYVGPPLAFELASELFRFPYEVTYEYQKKTFLLIPIAAVELLHFWGRTPDLKELVLECLPSLLAVPILLCLARYHLVRRAFVPASNPFLRPFRWLDALMKRGNHLVGNVVFRAGKETLPGDAPIFWRETTKRALGKMHYLVRILLIVETLVIILCIATCAASPPEYYGQAGGISIYGQADGMSMLAAFAGSFAALIMSVQAANTIVSERLQQTLEVLLTTPLCARQIVLEKARALHRLMLVLALPLLTIFAVEYWLEWTGQPSREGPFAYPVCAVLMVLIYLPWIMWLSLWIGLRVRTRFRAIIAALATLVLWLALPVLILIQMIHLTHPEDPLPGFTIVLSPLLVAATNESSGFHAIWQDDTPWRVLLIHAGLYTLITLFLRHRTLATADRCLRR